jgi:hypothetical protein
MPYKVVIVEDELEICDILRAKIEISDEFEIIDEVNHPAGLDGKPYSRLVSSLNKILSSQSSLKSSEIIPKEDCLYIILDLSFGTHENDYGTGLEVATFLTQKYEYREWIHILIATNHNDAVFWQIAYDLGIRVMAPKTHALPNIVTMLEHLVLERDYLYGIQVRTGLLADDINSEIKVARLLAMGYSLQAIKQKNLPAATTQKSLFRSKFLEHFVDTLQNEAKENAIKIPGKNKDVKTKMIKDNNGDKKRNKTLPEWGDALFLLYALRQGDPKVIKYVEKVCKIQITIPPTKSQGLFGIMRDNGPELRG